MKKAIIAILMLLTIGCSDPKRDEFSQGVLTYTDYKTEVGSVQVIDIEHNGHKYIVFKSMMFTHGVSIQIIHDPDCKCFKEDQQ